MSAKVKRSGVKPKQLTAASAVNVYGAITNISTVRQPLNTSALFEHAHVATRVAPIDEFILNTNALNSIAFAQNPLTREMSALLLLGYVSATESYIRALVREIVKIDEVARQCSEPQLIPFGAAVSHDFSTLAEALLERHSFASKANLLDMVKDFLGVKDFAKDVGSSLDEFQRICELRHCCAHRFGKLGAKNAISLGLDDHKHCLEKPLLLDVVSFQELAQRLRTFAKALNNALFGRLLWRTAHNRDDQGIGPLYGQTWTWNFVKDRRRFMTYYKVFASAHDSIPSPSAFALYSLFRAAHA